MSSSASPSPSRVPLPPSVVGSRRSSGTALNLTGLGASSRSPSATTSPKPLPAAASPRSPLGLARTDRIPELGRNTMSMSMSASFAAAGEALSGSILAEPTSPADPFFEGATISISQPVGSLSISPSSRDVCLASRKGLYILDLANVESAPRFVPQGGTWQIADCQWSPHPVTANLILSTSSQKLLVWDLAAQVALHRSIDAHERAITDINWHAINPNLMGTVAMDSGVRAWDLRTDCSRPATRLSAWGVAGTQIKWNRRAEHVLATANGKEVLVWDDRKGSIPVVVLKAHDAKIYGIDWDRRSPDKLVTCSLDKTIKFWQIPTLSSGDDGMKDDEPPSNDPFTTQTISTNYPVWRARNLPFGQGVLALPQRGETALEMFGVDAGNAPLQRFEGSADVVKEFVWRVRGGDDADYEDRDFQLISWSKDRKLRVWPVARDIAERMGYKRGAPITVYQSRRGAKYETFATIPGAEKCGMLVAPPLTDHHTPSAPQTLSGIARQRLLHHPPAAEAGMTRGGGTAREINQLDWLTKVVRTRTERTGPESDSSRPGSRSQSTHGSETRSSRERSASKVRDTVRPLRSASQARGVSRDLGDVSSLSGPDYISLKEEVLLVHKMFPKSKLNFEKLDLTSRKLTMSLNGPWANGDRYAFIRIHWSFPPNYPFGNENPTFELERNATVALITRNRIVSTIKEIRAANKQCLVSVTEFLLGYHERTGRRVIDEESGSESDVATAQNVPMLVRTTGAVFGPNGTLACFFPKQTVLPRTRGGKSLSPSANRDPLTNTLSRAINALSRLENPHKPATMRYRKHVRRLKAMMQAPEAGRASTVTLHSVGNLTSEPDASLAALYSTSSIDANLVHALDAKRLDHAEVWASLRALLADPPPPYAAHVPVHRIESVRRERALWDRDMERKRRVLDALLERLMDKSDIQLLALVVCILLEHERGAPPPPVPESIVQHSPEQSYFVLPPNGDVVSTPQPIAPQPNRRTSMTPTTPVSGSGPSSFRTSGWSQILMNPSSISLRGMALTPRDRISFDGRRTPVTGSFDDGNSGRAPSPVPTRGGVVIPRADPAPGPISAYPASSSSIALRRSMDRRESGPTRHGHGERNGLRDSRPPPLSVSNYSPPMRPQAGSLQPASPGRLRADRDRSTSMDAGALGSAPTSGGARSHKVSFGSASPLRRAFTRPTAVHPPIAGRKRSTACSVRIDLMNDDGPPPTLLRPELLPLAEVWKLAYADILLRFGLVGRRAAILQYTFAPVEGNAVSSASGELAMQQLELASLCQFCESCVVPPDQNKCDECSRSRAPPLCTVCRLPVKGLATTCTICTHTSHIRCLRAVLGVALGHCPTCSCDCLAERGISGSFFTQPKPRDLPLSRTVSYGFTPAAQRRLSMTEYTFDGPHGSFGGSAFAHSGAGSRLDSPSPSRLYSESGVAGGGGLGAMAALGFGPTARAPTDDEGDGAASPIPMTAAREGLLARSRLRALGSETILGW